MTRNGRVAAAIELMRGRGIFSPDEVRLVIEAAREIEEKGEPYVRAETKVLDLADRFAHLGPAHVEPRVDPALAERIAEASARAEAAAQLHGVAVERLHEARQALAAASRRTRRADDRPLVLARAEEREAEEELRRAGEASNRARARLTTLRLAAQAGRRAAALAASTKR